MHVTLVLKRPCHAVGNYEYRSCAGVTLFTENMALGSALAFWRMTKSYCTRDSPSVSATTTINRRVGHSSRLFYKIVTVLACFLRPSPIPSLSGTCNTQISYAKPLLFTFWSRGLGMSTAETYRMMWTPPCWHRCCHTETPLWYCTYVLRASTHVDLVCPQCVDLTLLCACVCVFPFSKQYRWKTRRADFRNLSNRADKTIPGRQYLVLAIRLTVFCLFFQTWSE